ncbi:MAG TPA: SRPBCC family protein [Thermoleophilaceae bacterium]|nr:SRPBCC family protein [Thermoleophilaceae bacterium]
MSRTVEAAGHVALQPDEAAALWRDPRRWSAFVEGFQRIEELAPGWPEPGSRVVWDSGPGGRGRVTEKVAENAPTRFATKVYEDRLYGTQSATFAPDTEGGASVVLSLEYELSGDNPLNPVTDLLFIRRALRDALGRTLRRFIVEAEEEAALR